MHLDIGQCMRSGNRIFCVAFQSVFCVVPRFVLLRILWHWWCVSLLAKQILICFPDMIRLGKKYAFSTMKCENRVFSVSFQDNHDDEFYGIDGAFLLAKQRSCFPDIMICLGNKSIENRIYHHQNHIVHPSVSAFSLSLSRNDCRILALITIFHCIVYYYLTLMTRIAVLLSSYSSADNPACTMHLCHFLQAWSYNMTILLHWFINPA